ncbi:dGTP triphosphohydrolase [Selenomonas ruminantium]|uniref:dGTPase n=1 Tax=Selenomonas ruminantium TaxID=971 RepID=A0A1H0S0H8_SELRU|nr:dNTP triphosphohydrolase [Selenomonas ruminantium]SDP35331.1 dGTPase [Selenomonas ruminantium]
MDVKRYNWQRLLSTDRERKPEEKNDIYNSDKRTEFEKDYNRTICSSAVRRLQNKTQVFPLQENDIVRNRLTHSMEVSSIGRSMGQAIGNALIDDDRIKDKAKKDGADSSIGNNIANILAVTGLIHDLGNPPFGHYGESIIRKWFENKFTTLNGVEKDKREQKDFLNFEGNAQSLRIVSKLQNLNDGYGLNLTYATLGAMIKYPRGSEELSTNKKKFGYFASEEELMKRIFEATETGKHERKNPLSYILEAADDITYLLDDIEDGVRKGVIEWGDEKKKLVDELAKIDDKLAERFYEKEEKLNNSEIKEKELAYRSVQNFRVLVQGGMILSANDVFVTKYDDIMNNDFNGDLVINSTLGKYVPTLKEVTRRCCFNSKEVLKLELAGDSILTGLMDMFWPAINEGAKKKNREGKLYSLISPNFIRVYNSGPDTSYYRHLLLTDYISGMTDSYALKLYRELTGYKLPYGV